MRVDHDASPVGGGGGGAPDPRPRPVGLRQRGLQEVLAEVAVAGDEAGGAQQTRAVIGDEIGELVVPWIDHVPLRRSVSRGGRRKADARPHSVSYRSHNDRTAPWPHRSGADGPCCTGASVGARNLAPWLWRST